MAIIRKIDHNDSKSLLRLGEFGMDVTPGGATENTVFIGTGTQNIALSASSGAAAVGKAHYDYVEATIADRDGLSPSTNALCFVDEDKNVYEYDGSNWVLYVNITEHAIDEALAFSIALG